MPSKTSSKSVEKKSERLHLAEAIANYTKFQEQFLSAYDSMKEYTTDIFKNLDLQIDTKQTELDELAKTYKNTETDLKIETDQAYKEHAYDKAIEVLAEHGEIAVSEDKYDRLKDELEDLREKQDEEVESAVEKERKSGQTALHAAVANSELKHQAQIAEIKAISMQKEGQVEMLLETIESMKAEIREQRKLTQAVAEASKQGAISQSFGKQ